MDRVALILEIRDANGARSWHRLDSLPLTLGRGLANDIILDDPYLDARHARIALDASGALAIDDLGSVNGLFANDVRAEGRAAVHAGSEVRIGRTVLRFRDVDEVVPPALVDDRAFGANGAHDVRDDAVAVASSNGSHGVHTAAPESMPLGDAARRPTSLGTWLTGTVSGKLLAIAATLAVFTVNSWLGNATRGAGSAVLSAVLALVAMTSIWAAVWTFAGRGSERRPSFFGHVAVISLGLLAALVIDVVAEWLGFLRPDLETAVTTLTAALYLVLVAALVAAHLSLSSTLSRRRRWRAGAMISGTIIVLAILAVFAKDDKFTDVPKFAAVLKPVSARWIPSESVRDFSADMRALKKSVDDSVKTDDATP